MSSIAGGCSLSRALLLSAAAVGTALLLSLIVNEVRHTLLPVYTQMQFYVVILCVTRLGGALAGIAAFCLAIAGSDFLLTEPLYKLFIIDDVPDFATFVLAAAGSLVVGLVARKIADDPLCPR